MMMVKAKECAKSLLGRDWDDEMHTRLGIEALLSAKAYLKGESLETNGFDEETVEEDILDSFLGREEKCQLVEDSIRAIRERRLNS